MREQKGANLRSHNVLWSSFRLVIRSSEFNRGVMMAASSMLLPSPATVDDDQRRRAQLILALSLAVAIHPLTAHPVLLRMCTIALTVAF